MALTRDDYGIRMEIPKLNKQKDYKSRIGFSIFGLAYLTFLAIVSFKKPTFNKTIEAKVKEIRYNTQLVDNRYPIKTKEIIAEDKFNDVYKIPYNKTKTGSESIDIGDRIYGSGKGHYAKADTFVFRNGSFEKK